MQRLVLGFLLFLGVSLSSLYIFPSGTPQISDFILLLFSALVFLFVAASGKLYFPVYFKFYLYLIVWVFSVSAVWSIIYQSYNFLMSFSFYFYNFIIVLSVCLYMRSYRGGLDLFRASVIASMLVSGVGVAVNIGVGGRVTGFFNNPNQLAYFSLLGASLIVVLYSFRVPVFSFSSLALGASVVGVLSAASLGAMAGLVFVTIGYVLANSSSTKSFIKIIAIIPFLFIAFFLFDVFSGGVVSDNLAARFDRFDNKVDDLYGERKYNRIAAFPKYWLLGAGEGHVERFYPHDGGEIHSTLGNIFFSYGVIGLFFFLGILIYISFNVPFYVSLVLFGPLIYSLTHMGTRTTFFWLLLMASWYVYIYSKEKSRSADIGLGRV